MLVGMLLAATAVWGWTFTVMKDAVDVRHYGVVAFLAIRFAIGSALLGACRRFGNSTGVRSGSAAASASCWRWATFARRRPALDDGDQQRVHHRAVRRDDPDHQPAAVRREDTADVLGGGRRQPGRLVSVDRTSGPTPIERRRSAHLGRRDFLRSAYFAVGSLCEGASSADAGICPDRVVRDAVLPALCRSASRSMAESGRSGSTWRSRACWPRRRASPFRPTCSNACRPSPRR